MGDYLSIKRRRNAGETTPFATGPSAGETTPFATGPSTSTTTSTTTTSTTTTTVASFNKVEFRDFSAGIEKQFALYVGGTVDVMCKASRDQFNIECKFENIRVPSSRAAFFDYQVVWNIYWSAIHIFASQGHMGADDWAAWEKYGCAEADTASRTLLMNGKSTEPFDTLTVERATAFVKNSKRGISYMKDYMAAFLPMTRMGMQFEDEPVWHYLDKTLQHPRHHA